MRQDKRLNNEIVHGKYLASNVAGELWNWESPAGKLRLKRRIEMLSSPINTGDQVLELGCGTGYFTKELAKLNIDLTAIDISPELIEQAIKVVKSEKVSFQIQNAYQMEFGENRFDAVIGSSVLHHLDIRKAISEIYRVLRPGGCIVFTEPNMMNPQIALKKNIPCLKKKFGDSPDETAFFRWKIKKSFRDAGFRRIDIIPFDFLHRATPLILIKPITYLGIMAESTPLLKEIAGSLYIQAVK